MDKQRLQEFIDRNLEIRIRGHLRGQVAPKEFTEVNSRLAYRDQPCQHCDKIVTEPKIWWIWENHKWRSQCGNCKKKLVISPESDK